MAHLNVTLTEDMKVWVESRTRRGRYEDASDYIRELIRQDCDREGALPDLRALIQQDIDSRANEEKC